MSLNIYFIERRNLYIMNLSTVVVLIIIAVLFIGAVRYLYKNNSHCAGCSACKKNEGAACPHCKVSA